MCTKPRLIAMMPVKNEADRYLEEVLTELETYADVICAVNDGSDDDSAKVLLSHPKVELLSLDRSLFHEEYKLRQILWNMAINNKPDWIIGIDADEVFELRFKDEVVGLMTTEGVDAWYFRVYDFWDSRDEYREDNLWRGHLGHHKLMVRYKPELTYSFRPWDQHVGRFPDSSAEQHMGGVSELRLKHLGWLRLEDRLAKYIRYMKLDPSGAWGNMRQYSSILDTNPSLKRWEE